MNNRYRLNINCTCDDCNYFRSLENGFEIIKDGIHFYSLYDPVSKRESLQKNYVLNSFIKIEEKIINIDLDELMTL